MTDTDLSPLLTVIRAAIHGEGDLRAVAKRLDASPELAQAPAVQDYLHAHCLEPFLDKLARSGPLPAAEARVLAWLPQAAGPLGRLAHDIQANADARAQAAAVLGRIKRRFAHLSATPPDQDPLAMSLDDPFDDDLDDLFEPDEAVTRAPNSGRAIRLLPAPDARMSEHITLLDDALTFTPSRAWGDIDCDCELSAVLVNTTPHKMTTEELTVVFRDANGDLLDMVEIYGDRQFTRSQELVHTVSCRQWVLETFHTLELRCTYLRDFRVRLGVAKPEPIKVNERNASAKRWPLNYTPAPPQQHQPRYATDLTAFAYYDCRPRITFMLALTHLQESDYNELELVLALRDADGAILHKEQHSPGHNEVSSTRYVRLSPHFEDAPLDTSLDAIARIDAALRGRIRQRQVIARFTRDASVGETLHGA